ncbi:MAG: RecQ family ATP-dependent DNA helicase [Gemmatimonadota bacterium]
MRQLLEPSLEMLRRFGIDALRPGQQRAFDAIAAGRDVLIVLPTGGGKSLCYQLPAACGAAPAIVVSPLVALMKDQVDALHRRGIAAAQLSGAVSAAARQRAWSRLEQGELTLLYLAPEALAARATLDRLASVAPPLLAIDEAHCISEWGESFRPAYLALGEVRRALAYPQTVALTATATPRTARDIIARLELRDPVIVSGGFDRANLRLSVRPVATAPERASALLSLGANAPGAAIVYAPSRRETERLAAAYTRVGIAAAPFHAGLPTDERARLQDRFQANHLRLIVATIAFGMGVDKPDVRLVVHAAPPLTLEAYYQEAGRGGRDGAIADCVLLLAPDDLTRAQARVAATRVTDELVARLTDILANATQSRKLDGRESEVISQLARCLAAAPRDISAALRLMSEEGLLAHSVGIGELRLLATERRLQTDRTLPDRDAEGLLRLVGGMPGVLAAPQLVTMRQLADVAPERDPRAWLHRLESRQLAIWRPLHAPWTLVRLPPQEVLSRLVRRHETRQARDLWRQRQVARMVTSSRCRRLVLLRYFGDAGPARACGACDRCGFTA